jgi:hypothetical protein
MTISQPIPDSSSKEAPQPTGKLSEMVTKYVDLYRQQKRAKADAKALGKELSTLEPVILEMMGDEGLAFLRLEDGAGVSIHERVWAKIVAESREDAVQALKDAGFNDLVKEDFNLITLSAFVAEYYQEGKPLPDEFAGKIEANPTYSLGVTKA